MTDRGQDLREFEQIRPEAASDGVLHDWLAYFLREAAEQTAPGWHGDEHRREPPPPSAAVVRKKLITEGFDGLPVFGGRFDDSLGPDAPPHAGSRLHNLWHKIAG